MSYGCALSLDIRLHTLCKISNLQQWVSTGVPADEGQRIGVQNMSTDHYMSVNTLVPSSYTHTHMYTELGSIYFQLGTESLCHTEGKDIVTL